MFVGKKQLLVEKLYLLMFTKYNFKVYISKKEILKLTQYNIQMNKIRINSVVIVLFFFLGLNLAYSQSGVCVCDQCYTGTEPECGGFPDAGSCYYNTPVCGGAPINENAYLLIVLGGILVFTIYWLSKNKKLISSNYLSSLIK